MFAHRLDIHPYLSDSLKITRAEEARLIFEPSVANLDHEVVVVAYLKDDLSVQFVSFYEGTQSEVDLDMRKILRDICLSSAPAVVIAHNHPSGNSTASRSDKIWTKRLYEALTAFDVVLLDHIIFASGSAPYSFRQQGLI